MNQKVSLWQRLRIGMIASIVGALAVNAVIGIAMLHSPDGARMLAMHAAKSPRMIADLGSLPAVQVCARKLPA